MYIQFACMYTNKGVHLCVVFRFDSIHETLTYNNIYSDDIICCGFVSDRIIRDSSSLQVSKVKGLGSKEIH